MDKVLDLIRQEEKRQRDTLMLIPSENYAWPEVRQAVGSVLMHKYAEGTPARRYYQGTKYVDEIETLAIERARKLFNVPYVNVQPLSGALANLAVYFALLNTGDRMAGLKLSHGGHLTHGHPKITFAGKYFETYQITTDLSKPEYFDFEKIAKETRQFKPKLIILGTTSFPRKINWQKFREIADTVGAYLVADISHEAGLIAARVYPSSVPYVHIVTSTTQKTLRGPRGAFILVTDQGLAKDPELAKKIERAVFPGLQGGPHMHTIAGIAIALEKASKAEFKTYAQKILENAQTLAKALIDGGFDLVTGGTDNHLILLNLRNLRISGKEAAERLEQNGIIVNKNAIPDDPNPPNNPSGIRLGTPAITARGMGREEMELIGSLISRVIVKDENVLPEVRKLCSKFPI